MKAIVYTLNTTLLSSRALEENEQGAFGLLCSVELKSRECHLCTSPPQPFSDIKSIIEAAPFHPKTRHTRTLTARDTMF